MGALQTEFEFRLPKGYVDDAGTLHRRGKMRLATARDEIEPLRDSRVSDAEDPFLTLLVLSRVITSLGSLPRVTVSDIEGLFAADLAFLQDFYGVINFGTPQELAALVDSVSADDPAPAPQPAADPAPAASDQPQGVAPDPASDPTDDGSRPRRGMVEEVATGGGQ